MAYYRDVPPRSKAGKAVNGVAAGLGWFSIGLGLCELLAPQLLTRKLGRQGHEPLVRLYGLREIVTGIGLLTATDHRPWLWARVGGDALDALTLLGGRRGRHSRDGNLGRALVAVAGIAALDLVCAQAASATARAARRPLPDYRDRSGLPRPPQAMRGAARDFPIPRDMRVPEALRPYTAG